MIVNENQLSITLEQLARVLKALDDLKRDVLPDNPQLFGVMAESCFEELERLRNEINEYLQEIKPAG